MRLGFANIHNQVGNHGQLSGGYVRVTFRQFPKLPVGVDTPFQAQRRTCQFGAPVCRSFGVQHLGGHMLGNIARPGRRNGVIGFALGNGSPQFGGGCGIAPKGSL